jgi:glucose-1-phosphate cytidylyltransferase
MKALLLAGGLGTRISEETSDKPKPMVEIDGKPILWHLMEIFSKQGIDEFVIALGYKGDVIKRWLKDLHELEGDIFINLKNKEISTSGANELGRYSVSTLDTGLSTQTGGRIMKCLQKFPSERLLVTYGDGLGNVSIPSLLEFHKSHGKLATVTAMRPPARFGHLELDGDSVVHFGEKNQSDEGWINGGFFVLEPEVLPYISGLEEPFETGALPRLAAIGELQAFKHFGFWQPMDTLREKQELEKFAKQTPPPWLKDI